MFGPGLATTQRRVPHLASVIDIAPANLDMLGLEIPSVYQGVSLVRTQPDTALFDSDYSTRLVGLREGAGNSFMNSSLAAPACSTWKETRRRRPISAPYFLNEAVSMKPAPKPGALRKRSMCCATLPVRRNLNWPARRRPPGESLDSRRMLSLRLFGHLDRQKHYSGTGCA